MSCTLLQTQSKRLKTQRANPSVCLTGIEDRLSSKLSLLFSQDLNELMSLLAWFWSAAFWNAYMNSYDYTIYCSVLWFMVGLQLYSTVCGRAARFAKMLPTLITCPTRAAEFLLLLTRSLGKKNLTFQWHWECGWIKFTQIPSSASPLAADRLRHSVHCLMICLQTSSTVSSSCTQGTCHS